MRSDDWLNGVMEFDHPIRVNEDGSVTERGLDLYAPESVIETTHDGSILKEHEDRWIASMRDEGWEPARGYSSQDRYSGPVMHACESIGGNLETYIRVTPGVWVAVTVECLRGDPDGAGEGFDPDTHTCGDCRDSLDEPYDGEEPAGWAVLHMDDGPETSSYVVTTRPGEITPALISGRCRVTLPRAREIARLIPHLPARIVRVTDLAVLPIEGCPDGNAACDGQGCPEHPAHDSGDHTFEQHHCGRPVLAWADGRVETVPDLDG